MRTPTVPDNPRAASPPRARTALVVSRYRAATAGDYYLERDAGCEAHYYLEPHEAAGRWVGVRAAAIELAGPLDTQGEEAFRRLLTGAHPWAGRQLACPVVRADPAGRLPPRPLVTALTDAARDRGLTDPGELFADDRPADTYRGVAASDRRRPFARSLNPRVAEKLAAAAGLDLPEQPSWPDEGRRRHDALYEPEPSTRGMQR